MKLCNEISRYFAHLANIGGADIAPVAEKTYNSQNTFELTIGGSKATTYIYMGDSWDSKGGPGSTYVWLPINVDSSNKTLSLDYHAMWKVDVNTGVVTFPAAGKRYIGQEARVSKRGFSNGEQNSTQTNVDYTLILLLVAPGEEITFRNITGGGKRQWVVFNYMVSNPEGNLPNCPF